MNGVLHKFGRFSDRMRHISDMMLLSVLYILGVGGVTLLGKIMGKTYLVMNGGLGTWQRTSSAPATDTMY